ncbi:polyprenyl synthetase family protein [Quadrisphaera sp. DSM 44207]|uniref:polyprenyl synthetase family protein n=1 Tax=Quadrisphaera sp. DSM 44207 TaxID=1881057 RepID=UPI0008809E13|nr:heptaprenyl diphosphate synthase [Quadrisphaera sp. DSM 44207]
MSPAPSSVPGGPARGSAGLPAVDPALTETISRDLDDVEERLLAAVAHADELADATSRHLVVAGGKRVRPMLTLLCAQLGDGTGPQVLTAAVAVELTHLASLYHDDVMDSAAVRRGAPSAHALWGNDIAILTGDLLFARASRLVADLGPDAVRLQAETFERLCLGQMHETTGPRPGEDAVAHHLQVLADKTGSLIATSARYGAGLAGCGRDVVDVVAAYGERVGVAFQLADDVLDLAETTQQTGKTPGTDLREGVATLPVLLARQRAAGGDAQARDLVEVLDGDLSGDDALAAAVQALRASSVTEQAQAQARQWGEDAVAALDPLPAGAVKDALVAFARGVTDRSS